MPLLSRDKREEAEACVTWFIHDVGTRVGSITGCCCQLPGSA